MAPQTAPSTSNVSAAIPHYKLAADLQKGDYIVLRSPRTRPFLLTTHPTTTLTTIQISGHDGFTGREISTSLEKSEVVEMLNHHFVIPKMWLGQEVEEECAKSEEKIARLEERKSLREKVESLRKEIGQVKEVRMALEVMKMDDGKEGMDGGGSNGPVEEKGSEEKSLLGGFRKKFGLGKQGSS